MTLTTVLTKGILPWNFLSITALFLIMTHITNAAVTMYLHRSQAHRAVIFNPIINHFFRFYLWFTTGMITKEWVAIHRKHHVNCDAEGDPHSPVTNGILNVVFGGVWLYRKAAKDTASIKQYGKNTPEDWIERKLYTPYNFVGVFILLVIEIVCFGVPAGALMWTLQMSWMPFWGAGVVNGIGHFFGYRNYNTKDHSRNIFPFGILLCGEELHNNHHAFPSSSRLSRKFWEIDLGWVYIKFLSAFYLAKIKNEIDKPAIVTPAQ